MSDMDSEVGYSVVSAMTSGVIGSDMKAFLYVSNRLKNITSHSLYHEGVFLLSIGNISVQIHVDEHNSNKYIHKNNDYHVYTKSTSQRELKKMCDYIIIESAHT
jgi:hypothetical protein